MTDVLSNYDQPAPKRPTFLTVICILTFIGSGLGTLNNIYGYLTPEKSVQAMEILKTRMPANSSTDRGNRFAEQMAKGPNVFTVENFKIVALGGIIAGILCLIGAIMMWNLKKPGFYAYVLGTVVGVAVALYAFGSNIFAVLGAAIGGFVGIAFCIMYAVNLKHMK